MFVQYLFQQQLHMAERSTALFTSSEKLAKFGPTFIATFEELEVVNSNLTFN